jgi:hypothetical protein
MDSTHLQQGSFRRPRSSSFIEYFENSFSFFLISSLLHSSNCSMAAERYRQFVSEVERCVNEYKASGIFRHPKLADNYSGASWDVDEWAADLLRTFSWKRWKQSSNKHQVYWLETIQNSRNVNSIFGQPFVSFCSSRLAIHADSDELAHRSLSSI